MSVDFIKVLVKGTEGNWYRTCDRAPIGKSYDQSGNTVWTPEGKETT